MEYTPAQVVERLNALLRLEPRGISALFLLPSGQAHPLGPKVIAAMFGRPVDVHMMIEEGTGRLAYFKVGP